MAHLFARSVAALLRRKRLLGSTPVALGILLVGALFFLVQRWWFDLTFLMLSVIGGTQLNSPLKELFDRPRPFFSDQTLTFDGSGFPSGHAMTATVLWGALAAILASRESRPARQVAVFCAAATVVAIVAATRVYLGAHYFTDVVGGVAFGLLWLMFSNFVIRLAVNSRRGR